MTGRALPRQVAEWIDAELGDAHFLQGESKHRNLSRGFWSVIPFATPGGRTEHVVTLSRGSLVAAELRGVAWGSDRVGSAEGGSRPRWVGRTDERGQLAVRGLAAGTYFVRYVPWARTAQDVHILETVGDADARVALSAAARQGPDAEVCRLAEAALARLGLWEIPDAFLRRLEAGQPAEEELGPADWRASLSAPGGPRALLKVAVGGTVHPAPLLRARLLNADGEGQAEGFLGLVPTPSGGWSGEADLDALAPGWRTGEGGLRLGLNPQPVEALDGGDHDTLQRSHEAALPPYRGPLRRALAWLRDHFSDWLPAAAFGVPGREVVAVLPGDDAALADVVRTALADAALKLGAQAPNRLVVGQACAQLIGTARLAPLDRVRLLVTAAARLEDVRDGAGWGGASVSTPAAIGADTGATPGSTGPLEPPAARRRRLAELDNGDPLDRHQALLFRLAEYAGLEETEIAELLGMPEDDVRIDVDQARKTVNAGV